MRTSISLILSLSFVTASGASAQFTSRFRTNLKGDMLIVANGVMTCDRDDESSATCDLVESTTGVPVTTNDGTDNEWIDVDSDGTTYNSSTATLTLPGTSDVEWAGLYWYGNLDSGGADETPTDTRGEVKLQTPALSSYVTIQATTVDSLGSTRYMAFSEISDLIRTGGSGAYTVANVVAYAGNDDHVGGWMLLVITRDDTETLRHFSVFDGREGYGSGSSIDIDLNGFLTPLLGPVFSEVLFVALDGDAGLAPNPVRSDSVEFTPFGGATTKLSNALNDEDDFGNSTISYLGAHVGGRTPAHRNTLGFDVDVFDVGGLMSNGTATATATFSGDGSEGNDAVTAAFKTTIYAPEMDVLKTLVDLNGGSIRPGDTLAYTVTVTNQVTALDDAVNVSLTDAVPTNTTYVPESAVLVTTPFGGPATGALTDATGDDIASFSGGVLSVNLGVGADDSTTGGLDFGQSTSLSFHVVVNSDVGGELLRNQAEVLYEGETLALAGERYPAVAFSHPPVGAGPTTGAVGSDDDGLADDKDPDDDNDGITDASESPGFSGDPGDDADADGVPAWKDPDEVPGGCTDDGGSPARCTALPPAIDADGDGIPNHLDRDADGDGIPDTVENGSSADGDGDGLPDDLTDGDGDGMLDVFDVAPADPGDASSNVIPRETADGDALADFLDRDSDGDGLTDAYEAGYTDDDGDGIPDAHSDTDGDGVIDTRVTPRNTNQGSDSVPDYVDVDSDGDGLGDGVEAFDTDGSGALNGGESAPLASDADGDGIDDQYDPDCPGGGCAGGSTQVDPSSLTASQDQDGDGTPDWLQVCRDGYVTGSEACDDGNQTDGDNCNNSCLRGLNVACAASNQCASSACHDDTDACEICTDDATGSADVGCAGAAPVCIESSGDGACVACEDDQGGTGADDGCFGGKPLCDDTSNTCVACLDTQSGGSDLGCSVGTPVCNTGSDACVACEDTDGGTTLSDVDFGCSAPPFCDAGSGTCIACLNDGNCDDGNACTTNTCGSGSCSQMSVSIGTSCGTDDVCDGAGVCADCANLGSGQDPGCDASAPLCDAASNAAGLCVECLANGDCGVGDYCDSAGRCQTGCDSDDDCATGTCDEGNTECVTCIDSAAGSSADDGCTDGSAPVCDGAAGSGLPGTTCVQCNADDQCPGVCDGSNACVTCTDSAAGSSTDAGCGGGTPLCNTALASEGVCVACLGNGDCGAGEYCNPAGSCATGCDSDDDCATGVCDEPNELCATCVDSAAGTGADDGCTDGAMPVCAGASGAGTAGSACVECEADGQCLAVCDPGADSCATCYDGGAGTDPGCDASTSHCDTGAAGGQCRECLGNGDCGTGEYCDAVSACQTGCDSDDDCNSGVCHEASNTCSACVDSAAGAGPDDGCGDPDAPACDATGTGTAGSACVECTDDSACPSVCDGSTDACAVCYETGDGTDPGCDSAMPHCLSDESGEMCAQCRNNDDCGNGEYCDPSGACSEGCDSDDDCDGGVCDADAATCVTCYAGAATDGVDAGCSSGSPHCDESSEGGACLECLLDEHCGDGDHCSSEGNCERDPELDTDGDGIPDITECADPDDCRDSDDDGMPDYNDPDDDGDGVPTQDEVPDPDEDGDPVDAQDSDNDGTPDFLDPDDDGDGVPTEDEVPDPDQDGDPVDAQDSDNDGTPDFLDPDDDGDGVPTEDEVPDPDEDGDPVDAQDSDNDGTPDFLDPDDDGDGVPTEDEVPDPDEDGDPDDARDSDGDGTPDFLDDDDDGDGVPTQDEVPDNDGDGTPDYLEPPGELSGGYRGGAGCSAGPGGASNPGGSAAWFGLLLLAALGRRRPT